MKTFTDIANSWIEGLDVYEPGKPIGEVARELGFNSADEITKLASNENALGPSPKAVAAMRNDAGKMHFYPDGGAYYLKDSLSSRLGVGVENILPVNGSNEALEFLAHVFLSPGTNIVMADRAFVVYKLIAAVSRADVVTVPMKAFTHDLDAMADVIDQNTRIVFISNPNNPTSTVVDPAAIDAFMDKVPENVVVCFDEAYVELLSEELRPDTIKYVRDGRKVVVLRTFSKTYGLAGLRVGYAIAPEECIILLNKVRQPFNVNSMALSAAVAALDDDEYVANTRAMVGEGIEFYRNEFERLGLEYVPPTVNFVLVKTGQGRKMFELLQEQGVIVRPMDVYGLSDYIRITVGTRDENVKAVTALEKVLSD